MIQTSEPVAHAIRTGAPVVALETTIFSHLGLPSPHNLEALRRSRDAVTAGGAVPALTAVLDGVPRVGLDEADDDRVCGPARKAASRDLGVAIGQGWDYGATTVSASLRLAAEVGVATFATGGIGGVHRDWVDSADVSADLDALAEHQVVTVSAGAKIFLDLPGTLEYLETKSVPVLGWRTDEFPAFHARRSGLPVPHRVDDAAEVAAIARAHWGLGGGGVLVVAPVPASEEIPMERIRPAVDRALAAAAGEVGAAITPAVLAALAEATDGDSIPTNLALAENNAAVAAAIAVALARHP